VARGVPDPARRQTRSRATPRSRRTRRRASAAGGSRPRRTARLFSRRLSLVHYDNLMLCAPGEAVSFFESGAHVARRYDAGERVRRPRVQGTPIAATGIANIWEVCHHLRGEAGDRQIEGATVGLAHVHRSRLRLRCPHPRTVPPPEPNPTRFSLVKQTQFCVRLTGKIVRSRSSASFFEVLRGCRPTCVAA